MLKLLLGHWQAHRKKPTFVLTDDPLYCSHLSDSSSHAHQVYTVNRINPIYEDTDTEERTRPVGKSSSVEDTDGEEIQVSIPEPKKKVVRPPSDSEDNEGESGNDVRPYVRDSIPMSTDSDEAFESVVVAVDVHRISSPDDVIKAASNHSTLNRRHSLTPRNTASNGGIAPGASSSGFQTNIVNGRQMAALNRSESRLGKVPLLVGESSLGESSKSGSPSKSTMSDSDAKEDIRASLAKVLQSKLAKPANPVETSPKVLQTQEAGITRTDSSAGSEEIASSSKLPPVPANPPPPPPPPPPPVPKGNPPIPPPKPNVSVPEENGITRKDQIHDGSSQGSPVTSRSTEKRHHHPETTTRATSNNTSEEIKDKSSSFRERHKHVPNGHVCKTCNDYYRSAFLCQFLPGHWNYDNCYLPGMHGMCHHYVHPNGDTLLPPCPMCTADDHTYCQECSSVRHDSNLHRHKSQREGTGSDGSRRPPDGSSQDADDDRDNIEDELGVPKKQKKTERRSFRVPNGCAFCGGPNKLNYCCHQHDSRHLANGDVHKCTCNGQALSYLQRRRVKFAGEPLLKSGDPAAKGLTPNGIDGSLLLNPSKLHGLGHLGEDHAKTNGDLLDTPNRGKKEPIKVDDLYRTYPVDVQDWEAVFRRKAILRQRRRALTMIGMAIGIIIVVGIAITVTFMVIRRQR